MASSKEPLMLTQVSIGCIRLNLSLGEGTTSRLCHRTFSRPKPRPTIILSFAFREVLGHHTSIRGLLRISLLLSEPWLIFWNAYELNYFISSKKKWLTLMRPPINRFHCGNANAFLQETSVVITISKRSLYWDRTCSDNRYLSDVKMSPTLTV